MPENGQITSISMYHNAASSSYKTQFGIYANGTNNLPGNKLAATAKTTMRTTAGWQTINLATPINVTAGTKIWIAWMYQNANGPRRTGTVSGSPGYVTGSGTWSTTGDNMPASFGAATTTAGTNFSVYATYTPTYTLTTTVSPTGSGTVTRSPDKTVYTSGEVVRITPVRGSGYAFCCWDGDASGNASYIDVIMGSNKTIIANFYETYIADSMENLCRICTETPPTCDEARCLEKYYQANGVCICTKWTTGSTTPADGIYYNSTGDQLTVVNGVSNLSYMGIDLRKINSTHNTLIISFSGAGVYSDAKDETRPFETYLYGEQPPTTSTYGDGIYKTSLNYRNSRTVSVIGYPWFLISGGLSFNDFNWGPHPHQLAARIKEALSLMAPKSKLILIAKSMGGCKFQKMIDKLQVDGVTVDLLILVDPSCKPADQSNTVKYVLSNVKKVFNFRQISAYPYNDFQNGFSITWATTPTIGEDNIVSAYHNTSYPNHNLMCEGVGHDDIDECANLQAAIDTIIKAVLRNEDMTAIINLLLGD